MAVSGASQRWAKQDNVACGYLVSPGLLAALNGRKPFAFLHPLRSPRSLELVVDGNLNPFSPQLGEGGTFPSESKGQELLELPRRFARLTQSAFDELSWEHALREEEEGLPCGKEEPFCLPFTRGGVVIAQLLSQPLGGGMGATCYYDGAVLMIRYEASEQAAVWKLIGSMLRDFPLRYRPLSSISRA